jgi:NADPH:quinone reductase-like Zn-dependent oxidoreductase
MKGVVQDEYGGSEAFELREIDKPVVKDGEALVRVAAASLHAGDYFLATGVPYILRLGSGLRRPRRIVPGFDVSGYVEEVGANVTGFKTGDEVFGQARGTCAEFVCAKPDELALTPANLTIEHSAPLATSGVAALIGIRDAARAGPGRHILVNGASGGVGTYAVQIAKALGAEVTGVCSTKHVAAVKSIGADHVIDYTQEDLTRSGERYDAILDNVGNLTLAAVRGVLARNGKYLPNSGRSEGRWFGPFGRMAKAALLSPFVRQQGRPFFAPVKKEHLLALTKLVEENKVKPVIDRTYSLAEAAQAMGDVGDGHVLGKVLITM